MTDIQPTNIYELLDRCLERIEAQDVQHSHRSNQGVVPSLLALDIMKAMNELENLPNILTLDIEQARPLLAYFMQVGYISYNDHPNVHGFINQLQLFVEDND